MMFAKRLRECVRRGEITCSVRIWTRPHVKVGGRYRIDDGEIEVDYIEPIGFPDFTPELARASAFLGVLDLLKVSQTRPRRKDLPRPLSLSATQTPSGAQPVGLRHHGPQLGKLRLA
jgi:hypothetical protein